MASALTTLLKRTNFYRGVYYFTRENAETVANELGGSVTKTKRGFVVNVSGTAFGPAVAAPGLKGALAKAMNAGAGAVKLKFTMAFDADAPEAIAWVTSRGAELVTAITTEARTTIKRVVADGFANGVPPRDTARILRATVGLTERDAVAVMKRQVEMLAKGVKPEVATARAERYASKLNNSRALTIARTETMKASNEGQRQLWKQAQDSGLLPVNAKKVWMTADPCPLCAPMEGETVLIDDAFSVGQDPPLHPRCRCTIGLVA